MAAPPCDAHEQRGNPFSKAGRISRAIFRHVNWRAFAPVTRAGVTLCVLAIAAAGCSNSGSSGPAGATPTATLSAAPTSSPAATGATPTPVAGLPSGCILAPGTGQDLTVTQSCFVYAGTYQYGNISIYGGGSLTFADQPITLWAKSILIENGGGLVAGNPTHPIGANGGSLTITLYGPQSDPGIQCQTPGGTCGVPPAIWTSNFADTVPAPKCTMNVLPGGVSDCFYQYTVMDTGDRPGAYFGHKVLAVSYGGSLRLFGRKGATFDDLTSPTFQPSNSGTSWVRLAQTLHPGDSTLVLDRVVDWTAGDRIVVTTTDYMPSHSEQLTIKSVSTANGVSTVVVTQGVQYNHNGTRYDLSKVAGQIHINFTQAETRAAVALLSRSIRIISGGDQLGEALPPDSSGYYFGGHTIARQGFQAYQVQGVAFENLGQGGSKGHYPVHFHLTRRTPPNTFVKDCSISPSMTRWITLHGAQGIALVRNVGYESIGHGFYLEDGTETDNKFFSNIGILARAAVSNPQNPRNIPGILAAPDSMDNAGGDMFPYNSDFAHPSVFWITNGWNDFEYNMAAGAATCGACYWLVPAANSGMSQEMSWFSYASEQAVNSPTDTSRAGMTPLKKFLGNYCTSANNSFQTVGQINTCVGVQSTGSDIVLPPVPNPSAPASTAPTAPAYYPNTTPGGARFATACPSGTNADCSTVPRCSQGQEQNCMVTAIENYTSSFHWSEENFAAIWLRPQWYLVINSVLSDVLNGGLTFVTGGDFTRSSNIMGHWALARKNVFIGNSQSYNSAADNPYALNSGPFNPLTGLRCAANSPANPPGNYCLSAADGISMPLSNFGVNQRLFNIYDGPALQDSNAYVDIKVTPVTDCAPDTTDPDHSCTSSGFMQGHVEGVPYDANQQCYLPNAAIAWKQPNGFYYPPVFHSRNLVFNNVDIRHFVIEPLFESGNTLYQTDLTATQGRYCTFGSDMFNNFSDIDRQTELSDDDGSLTGLLSSTGLPTVSVNQDPFFDAPTETPQCASDVAADMNGPTGGTAKTSPYDYMTTVIYPACAQSGTCANWNQSCTSNTCFGVPLYRQYLTAAEQQTTPVVSQSIHMMGQLGERNNLSAGNGLYYIDTTVGAGRQQSAGAQQVSVFQPGATYYVFLVFAKPSAAQTYEMYVGKDPSYNPQTMVSLARVNIDNAPFQTTAGSWPAGWTRQYDPTTGILTVAMNLAPFQSDFTSAQPEHCQPNSFCKWQNNACTCALTGTDSLSQECQQDNGQAICGWAEKDLDCPAGGCVGFSVTLSPSFATDPTPDPRLSLTQPCCFPNNQDWNVDFTAAPLPVAGQQCYMPNPPAPQFCSGCVMPSAAFAPSLGSARDQPGTSMIGAALADETDQPGHESCRPGLQTVGEFDLPARGRAMLAKLHR